MTHSFLRHPLTRYASDRLYLPREADFALNLRVRIRR